MHCFKLKEWGVLEFLERGLKKFDKKEIWINPSDGDHLHKMNAVYLNQNNFYDQTHLKLFNL